MSKQIDAAKSRRQQMSIASFRALVLAPALVLMGLAPQALARGGPGGALGALLEGLLGFAIIAALVLGLLLRRSRVGRVAAYLLAPAVALGAALGNGFLMAFFLLPASVFLAVFWATSAVAGISSPALQANDAIMPSETQPASASVPGKSRLHIEWPRTLGIWIAASYLFWSLVSLANLKMLAVFAFPPFALMGTPFYAKFFPFLMPPLATALLAAFIVTGIFVALRRRAGGLFAVFIFNASLLLVFLGAAEWYKDRLITDKLSQRHAEHLYVESFLSSALEAGEYFRAPHATFLENGQTYCWSYSARDFYLCQ
ncbi:hypothetical protein [Undibacterium terreum]|uniref:Uncharacterized protein n=1 Tax=Undibacterium terreum TaxID=1224302 RepID=A0A916U9L4_9BURK|nr:hypothetical protein [Undibacterium terreum]GGC65609.1 hypothetical protein GCM10011396_10780 [Undibacterium terreum]